MIVMGIDSGLTGGLAALSDDDGLWIEPMPVREKFIDVKEFARLLRDVSPDVVYVESIFAIPKSGAHSMMIFGRTYGTIIGAIETLGYEWIEVRSQEWQRRAYAGCPDSYQKKERSLWSFQCKFPGVSSSEPGRKAHHMGMIEAALIAEYGQSQIALKG